MPCCKQLSRCQLSNYIRRFDMTNPPLHYVISATNIYSDTRIEEEAHNNWKVVSEWSFCTCFFALQDDYVLFRVPGSQRQLQRC